MYIIEIWFFYAINSNLVIVKYVFFIKSNRSVVLKNFAHKFYTLKLTNFNYNIFDNDFDKNGQINTLFQNIKISISVV